MRREKAVAVGNRAGIVEWANASWSRVTGYALEDAIGKPVGDLLGSAGIEAELIDFVRRRFEQGQPCEIELSLDPPGAAPRTIHVSVESLRDRHGEVSHFAAIAWEASEGTRRAGAARETIAQIVEPALETADAPVLHLEPTDLSAFTHELVARQARGGARCAFDLELPSHLPWVGVDRERVTEAVADVLEDAADAIGDEWGTVSLSTGLARSEAVFASPTYPRNCLLRGLPEGHFVYLEIHDTGPPVDRTAVAALSGRVVPAEAAGRVARLAAARALLRAHGGELRVDADPGFGTRVILLFPA